MRELVVVLACVGRFAHPTAVRARRTRLLRPYSYPAEQVIMHVLGLPVWLRAAAGYRIDAHTRRAPISRYFMTIEDHARALSEAGPAVMLICLSDGWSKQPAQGVLPTYQRLGPHHLSRRAMHARLEVQSQLTRGHGAPHVGGRQRFLQFV